MQKSELKLDNGNTVFTFDPNASYQGKTFISLTKAVKGFGGKPGKFQVLSISQKNAEQVIQWLRKCLSA